MFLLGPILIFLLLVAPGIRLLSLAHRSKQGPEFWGGLYFIGAAIGLAMRVLGSSLFLTEPQLANTINTIGHLAFASGTIAMTIFTLRVFHPTSSMARIFAGMTIAAILLTSAHTLLAGFTNIENSYSMVATNFARLIPTCWAFYESFRYWLSMRRRETLGLADPVLTNRFLLWSIWTGAVTLLPMIALFVRTLSIVTLGNDEFIEGAGAVLMPAVLSIIRVLFVIIAPVAAVSLSLSFFPPTAYLDRVRARGEASQTGAAA
jgi:hypothetical protein